ncbi:MAG: hypothetical protein H7Y42_04065 [Chitinophagaceae bacterium]|nr:hypothetical protein [Chitinophagaceae bacterium]
MRLTLIVLLLVSMQNAVQGQQLLKEKIQDIEPEVTISWKDSANILINSFNTTKNAITISKLADFFKRDDVKNDTSFMAQAAGSITLIDSASKADNLSNFNIPLVAVDTQEIGNKENKGTSGGGNCPELAKVVMILVTKNVEGAFDVSFADKKENPIGGFTFQQPNEVFFYDQVKESLLGLCEKDPAATDSAKVDRLIASFRKKSLYQHVLEAGLTVNDDDVYAGKLTIHKTVPVTFNLNTDNDSGKANADKSKTSRARFMKEDGDEQVKIPEKRSGSLVASIAPEESLPMANTSAAIGPTKKKVTTFTVHHIQIQFQDGFIENIKIRGKVPESGKLLKFENNYPIPFSTRRDYRRLYETNLMERTIYEHNTKNDQNVDFATMRLGELIDFDQNLDLDSKDYSPVNHVLDLEIKDAETVINLQKERTSKILELKVFTDLKGIEDDNPNGLVQIELSKKMNFWNTRVPVFRNLFNIGVLNYFTPSFTLSKIEKNNKRLPVQYIGSQEPDAERPNHYASTLQLLQYQMFRVGADISFLTIDIPGVKSIITVKSGLYFGRTLTVDTMRSKVDSMTFNPIPDNNIRESGVNSFQFIPEACLQIFPDKRYSVVLSYKLNRFDLRSSELTQVNDTLDYVRFIKNLDGDRSGISNYRAKKWIGTAEVFAFYRPSAYNQLFFRYRLNYDLQVTKTNFHQIQLGFATYLTHTKKGKKAKDKESTADPN